MNLHEYQSKQLVGEYAIPVPNGGVGGGSGPLLRSWVARYRSRRASGPSVENSVLARPRSRIHASEFLSPRSGPRNFS
jgi:hypothetical protein